jgi:hypothetical protein
VADIANPVRDGKVDDDATAAQQRYPLRANQRANNQLVERERQQMDRLRASVAAANKKTLILMAAVPWF